MQTEQESLFRFHLPTLPVHRRRQHNLSAPAPQITCCPSPTSPDSTGLLPQGGKILNSSLGLPQQTPTESFSPTLCKSPLAPQEAVKITLPLHKRLLKFWGSLREGSTANETSAMTVKGSLGNLGGGGGKVRCRGGDRLWAETEPLLSTHHSVHNRRACQSLPGSQGPLVPNKDDRSGGISRAIKIKISYLEAVHMMSFLSNPPPPQNGHPTGLAGFSLRIKHTQSKSCEQRLSRI